MSTELKEKSANEIKEDIQLNIQKEQVKKPGGIDISFKDLCYSVDITEKNKETKEKITKNRVILNNISGICQQGQLTAIMGSSGAGKTSLLNILCKRVQEDKTTHIKGDIKANDYAYTYSKFSDFASYIMQDDRLLETLTVKESLMFASNLKTNGTPAEKEKKVDNIIKRLKLEKCKDTLIGGNMLKGISGGERKRVSIAFELVSDPQVLFLDEPTSGLDSFTAFLTINLVKGMAKELNKTVVITIHSPSSDIWGLFDNFMLLVQGKFVYQGPGGAPVVDHFAKLGFKCPETSNPADYLMTICHKESKQNVENYPKYYEGYEKTLKLPVNNKIDNKSLEVVKSQHHLSNFTQEVTQIFKRTYKQTIRDPILLKSRLSETIVLSLLISALYWQLEDGKDNPTDVRALNDYTGYFFFQATFAFMSSMMPVILTFPTERGVFLKEENGKLYKVFSYFIGRTLLEFPFLLLFPFLQSLIQFYMIGLRAEEDVFFKFLFANIMISLVGNSMGLLIGSMFSDPGVASSVMPMFIMPFMILGGFYSNRENIWDGISWLEYLSPFKYGYSAFMQNEFSTSYFRPNPVETFSLDVTYWESIGVLLAMFFAYRLIAFLFLNHLKKRLQ